MDQDTRKISAAQLAEVLAKVDQRSSARERESGEVEARPTAPAAPPVAAPAAAGDAPPVSAPPQVLAVVERPVGERKVVNVTSPEAPSSSPRLSVADDHDSDPPETSSARAIAGVENAEAEARRIVEAGAGGAMTSALLVVALFVVGCVALVLANH